MRLESAAAKEESEHGDDTDDEIDGEADLLLTKRSEEGTDHHEDKHKPLQPAEERNDARHHDNRSGDATKDREELEHGPHFTQLDAGSNENSGACLQRPVLKLRSRILSVDAGAILGGQAADPALEGA